MPPEPTFQEHFRVSIELPIPEADFIELLDSEGISYEMRRLGHGPSPGNPELAAGRPLSHVITVYGEFDADLGRMATYQAHVGMDDEVLFIENSFSYVAVAPCFFSCR